MAHFAKLDENNIVVAVLSGRDEDELLEDELSARTGDTYKRTSYNTRAGVHYDPETNEPSEDQGKAFRNNFAGIGMVYDAERDAFREESPFPSWVLNEDSCVWESPVPQPKELDAEGYPVPYDWDEGIVDWVRRD